MYFSRKQILFSLKGWFMPDMKIAALSNYFYLLLYPYSKKPLFLATGSVFTELPRST
jgi:hypothetical protein